MDGSVIDLPLDMALLADNSALALAVEEIKQLAAQRAEDNYEVAGFSNFI